MKTKVKKIVKNWMDACDSAIEIENLNQEEKQDRIHGIKSVIDFCNRLEADNLLDKLKTVYPLQHPIKEYRKVPIKFNNE
jgi:hypothetical protein